MTAKKSDGEKKKVGPGQPDKDRRITQDRAMKVGRNAGSGQFTSAKKAQNQPKTHVVETIKKPSTTKQTKKK